MGLFFNRKNKKKEPQNDYPKPETHDTDRDKENRVSPYKDYDNPKFHRTKYEEELKSQFRRANISLINEFEQLMNPIKNLSSFALNEQIKAFDKYKKIFYDQGAGGKLYFQDMWEHCHNSKNECFSWRDNLLKSYNIQKQRERLYQAIPHTIIDNENLLQKDIYKLLPEFDKGIIQSVIRELEKDKIILREKSKGSYILSLI